jgi:signal transduction histidine kinase
VALPDLWRHSRPQQVPAASWYRLTFAPPVDAAQPLAVLLPWLYDGGQLWLNGALVAGIPENTPELHVRWSRPRRVSLPPALLRAGENELLVRAGAPPAGATVRCPRLRIGTEAELRPLHDRQSFWVRVTPQITVTVCLLAALGVLCIWWRRRSEVLCGLFGIAVLLWGLRTLTLVVEVVPAQVYPAWRFLFHSATGGFIVVMTMLAWRLAGIRQPWFERAILGYWLAGPVWLLAQGPAVEPLVNRWWVGGFLPIGATIVAVSAWSLVRRRTLATAALPLTMAVAAVAGMHDYAIAWDFDLAGPWFAAWAAHRFQLLHLAADLVLLAMGGLLTARFVHALEHVNGTLEARVEAGERELAVNGGRVLALERERASGQERQRILREIHDGLGSQLFVSLSRVERGDMAPAEVAETLRRCIAEMRLALDTVGPPALDFRSTLGNFLFRWRGQLLANGIRPSWDIDLPDESRPVSPHATLQLLRVAQEALTNVVQHAQASAVDVQLRLQGGLLHLEVRDDGLGAAAVSDSSFGRGLAHMRSRAAQLGGRCEVKGGSGGTRVQLQVPLRAVRA